MRLSAPFRQFSHFEISLTSFPVNYINQMRETGEIKNFEVKVKMTRRINKFGDNSEQIYSQESFRQHLNSHRHQLVLERKLFSSMAEMSPIIKIYSVHMNAEQIKDLGFESILKAENAEKEQLMLNKLADELQKTAYYSGNRI